MKLWVRPGKYCGVRNRRQGRLGISPFKNYSLTGHPIEIWGEPVSVAQEAHPVGAGGVYRDEDDIGGVGADGQPCTDQKQEKSE